jgi:transposase
VAGPDRSEAVLEKKSLRAAEQDRPHGAAARAAWRVRQTGLNPNRLVFIDETCATTTMTRRYGRGPTCAHVKGAVPHGHWKVTTFVAALRASGLIAPMTVDGALNGELFRAYVEQILKPTLRPGDLVVMENLQCHKVAGVAEAIEQARAQVVYLPPYSPDFNPIEQVFAKLRAELRRRSERNVYRLWDTLGESLDWFAPDECLNYFRHSGYTLQGK